MAEASISPKPRARKSPPKKRAAQRNDWHLVCITRKGKVSILKDLDLRTARLTYQKLCPETRPKKYTKLDCAGQSASWGGHCSMSYGSSSSDSDRLERVEPLGPEGVELDPWNGVKPELIDARENHRREVAHGWTHCSVCTPKLVAKKAAAERAAALGYVLMDDGAEEPEYEHPDDRWAAELFKQVPTAFWLKPSDDAKRRAPKPSPATAAPEPAKPVRISAAAWTGR